MAESEISQLLTIKDLTLAEFWAADVEISGPEFSRSWLIVGSWVGTCFLHGLCSLPPNWQIFSSISVVRIKTLFRGFFAWPRLMIQSRQPVWCNCSSLAGTSHCHFAGHGDDLAMIAYINMQGLSYFDTGNKWKSNDTHRHTHTYIYIYIMCLDFILKVGVNGFDRSRPCSDILSLLGSGVFAPGSQHRFKPNLPVETSLSSSFRSSPVTQAHDAYDLQLSQCKSDKKMQFLK